MMKKFFFSPSPLTFIGDGYVSSLEIKKGFLIALPWKKWTVPLPLSTSVSDPANLQSLD